MTTHLFTTWFTEYLQNILSLQLKAIALKIEKKKNKQTNKQKKKTTFFQNITSSDNASGHLRALMVLYSVNSVVVMPSNRACLWLSW